VKCIQKSGHKTPKKKIRRPRMRRTWKDNTKIDVRNIEWTGHVACIEAMRNSVRTVVGKL